MATSCIRAIPVETTAGGRPRVLETIVQYEHSSNFVVDLHVADCIVRYIVTSASIAP